MKKIVSPAILLFTSSLIFVQNFGYAQKLNNIQANNIWAPATIKVDGKLTEWNNSLAAYNKSTRLFYTIANDDKNLYLAIKSTDQQNNNKITSAGITFIINTSGKKKENDAFLITFPIINHTNMRGQMRGRQKQTGQAPDSAEIAETRKQMLALSKEISVTGFKVITDTLISIYNEYGVKAAVNYDTKGDFIYELAVPLSLLDISITSPKEMAYNIKVNGLQFGGFGGGGIGVATVSGFGGGGGAGRRDGGGVDMEDLMSTTDFWGKYILADKTTIAR